MPSAAAETTLNNNTCKIKVRYEFPGVDLERLTRLWTQTVLGALRPALLTAGGRRRPVLLADGIKVPKAGRKMPAVKKLHQESDSNTKPEYIFGHSCQAVALAVKAGAAFFALPLASRIHEGAVFSNRDRRTLLDKMATLAIGTYAYHFWMKAMNPRPRKSGNQYLHRESDAYRRSVRRKLRAYHCHIQLGVIAQGLLQALAVIDAPSVWRSFGSWLRTVRVGVPPTGGRGGRRNFPPLPQPC